MGKADRWASWKRRGVLCLVRPCARLTCQLMPTTTCSNTRLLFPTSRTSFIPESSQACCFQWSVRVWYPSTRQPRNSLSSVHPIRTSYIRSLIATILWCFAYHEKVQQSGHLTLLPEDRSPESLSRTHRVSSSLTMLRSEECSK